MNSNTIRAKESLCDGLTCVLCSNTDTITSDKSGIRPLMEFVSLKKDCKGYSAADKIVGKAAAMLYVLLGVDEVYAQVMSRAGKEMLSQNGIENYCDTLVEKIINRKGTGICPMEQTVAEIDNPYDAYKALADKIKAMNS